MALFSETLYFTLYLHFEVLVLTLDGYINLNMYLKKV